MMWLLLRVLQKRCYCVPSCLRGLILASWLLHRPLPASASPRIRTPTIHSVPTCTPAIHLHTPTCRPALAPFLHLSIYYPHATTPSPKCLSPGLHRHAHPRPCHRSSYLGRYFLAEPPSPGNLASADGYLRMLSLLSSTPRPIAPKPKSHLHPSFPARHSAASSHTAPRGGEAAIGAAVGSRPQTHSRPFGTGV